MQKKTIFAVIGVLGLLIFFFFEEMLRNTANNDNYQSLTVSVDSLATVAQPKKSKLIVDITSIGKVNDIVSSVTATTRVEENKKKLLTYALSQDNKEIITSSSNEQKLEDALQGIPINYHSVLRWKDGQDQALINVYSEVVENTITDDAELADENLEELFSNFIYQHELSTQITLEYISCNQTGCIIYGVELQSGVWNQLIDFARKQSWWAFSKDITRSSVGSDGNLVFFTVIR